MNSGVRAKKFTVDLGDDLCILMMMKRRRPATTVDEERSLVGPAIQNLVVVELQQ